MRCDDIGKFSGFYNIPKLFPLILDILLPAHMELYLYQVLYLKGHVQLEVEGC